MKTLILNLVCLWACVSAFLEPLLTGTVSGITLLPVGIVVFWLLCELCAGPKQETQEITITPTPKVEIVCRGKGWNSCKNQNFYNGKFSLFRL